MAHYDIDTTCRECGVAISIHPAQTDRRRLCWKCANKFDPTPKKTLKQRVKALEKRLKKLEAKR